jgi:PrcB C-terminal
VAAVVGGWFAYVELWRNAGAEPLRYRDLTAELRVQPTLSFARRFRRSEQLVDYVRRNGVAGARVPRVDWSRDEAILVSAGPRSSTGYALRLVRATDERGRIVVVVRERTPALRDPVRPRLTYPYRFLVFERTSKPIVVEWQGRP